MNEWSQRLVHKMRTIRQIADANSDQQDRGLQAALVIDRDTAARPGSE